MPRGQVDYSDRGLSTSISKLHIGTKKNFQQKFVHQKTYKPFDFSESVSSERVKQC